MSDLARAVMQAKALEANRIRQAVRDISAMSLPVNLDRPLAMTGSPTTGNEVEAENVVLDPLGRGGAWQSLWSAENGTLEQIAITDLPRYPHGLQSVTVTSEFNAIIGTLFNPPSAGEYWAYALVKTEKKPTSQPFFSVRQTFGEKKEEAFVHVPIVEGGAWMLVALKATLSLPATTLSGTQTLPLSTINVVSTAAFPTAGTLLIAGQEVAYTGKTSTEFTGCTGGGGTIPAGQAVTLSTPGLYRLSFGGGLPSGSKMQMTGATVCYGADPLEPFYGDLAASNRNLYDWAGAHDASRSRRYGPQFDLLVMREREARLGVAPVGFTTAQRQANLQSRWKARRKSASSTFIEQIVDLIQTENKSFTAAGVRVVTDFPNRSFEVDIAYSASGNLAERVRQLIEDTKPAHMACDIQDDVHFGTFVAGVSKAGEHL